MVFEVFGIKARFIATLVINIFKNKIWCLKFVVAVDEVLGFSSFGDDHRAEEIPLCLRRESCHVSLCHGRRVDVKHDVPGFSESLESVKVLDHGVDDATLGMNL